MENQLNNIGAIATLRLAADQGNIEAQYLLARAYRHGHGVQRDIAEAERRFQKIIEQGDDAGGGAQFQLNLIAFDNKTDAPMEDAFG